MSFFKKLFGSQEESTSTENSNKFNIVFGRYTDIGKTKKQLAFWDSTNLAFTEKKYYNCFNDLLHYIKDESLENVSITQISGTELQFEIIQGSKVLKGKATNEKFEAECAVVKMNTPSVPVMRKLMAMNYSLKYSKFALNENVICMKFSSSAIDAVPYKLYEGLKEMAINADKQDDLLVSEFGALEEIDTHQIIVLDESIKEIKYKYLLKWISDALAEIEKQDQEKMSGGISFLLLNLIYKIDYLIAPEGNLTNKLELMQSSYFAKNDLTIGQKNGSLIESFKEILAMKKDDILNGFYQVKATFAYANPAVRTTVMDKIFEEKGKAKWYLDNKYDYFVHQMYEYVFGYCFFNYGMEKPDRDLLDLLFHVYNQDYYTEMGFANNFFVDGKLNEKEIIKRVKQIETNAKIEYPNIFIDAYKLIFTSQMAFADSLFGQMDIMNYTK